ncbi:MAG: hypothetical protein KF878_07865 [Planctomycetes bacterium]|nr:hypothetical protein [Planctomycetota bacterium]
MLSPSTQKAVASLLVPTLLLWSPLPAAYAQERGDAAAGKPAVTAAEGKVEGRLLALDGKTPLQGRELVVRNAETGDLIIRVQTGEDGSFRLPELANGTYTVECDGAVHEVEIRRDRPLRSLKVLMPTGGEGGLRSVADVGSTILWVGAGAAVLLLAGVGGGILGYNLRHTTGRGSGGGAAPQGAAAVAFEVSPSGDFGTVSVGQSSQRTFVLRNLSSEVLQGTVVLTSSQFELVGDGGFSIPGNSLTTVTVRFRPTVAATHVGTIEAIVTTPAGVLPASKTLHGVSTGSPAVSPANP